MIYIKNNATGAQISITPTKFPDGTSQVWKLRDLDQYRVDGASIIWYFFEEAELIYVNQLICLLHQYGIKITELYIPFLPYGRQDKAVSNETTFAKTVFLEMLLTEMVERVTTLDSHSEHPKVCSYSPKQYIQKAIEEFKPDVIIFPDTSAGHRYIDCVGDIPFATLAKTRNQLTGEITGLEWNTPDVLAILQLYKQKTIRMLIVDDICDGGATFNNASMFLHQEMAKIDKLGFIGLYVTHGIYSKGFDKMIQSGISQFYTTQSIQKNVLGYDLNEV